MGKTKFVKLDQLESPKKSERLHCFICTEEIKIYAFGACNHKTCHTCCLRLRALYKNNTCAYCKTELDRVVMTSSDSLEFEQFDFGTRFKDDKLSVYMQDELIHEKCINLLKFNCPACDFVAKNGWKQLKEHVQQVHLKVMCDICTKYKKQFAHEHSIYTKQDLQTHFKSGDADDPSFKGHPQCGFCKVSFYGNDELYDHCKKKHEECFICDKQGIKHQYYVNYHSLENHFKSDHFCCLKKECLEKKFVVFGTEIDLKAHEAEVHSMHSTKKGLAIGVNFSYSRPSNEQSMNTSTSSLDMPLVSQALADSIREARQSADFPTLAATLGQPEPTKLVRAAPTKKTEAFPPLSRKSFGIDLTSSVLDQEILVALQGMIDSSSQIQEFENSVSLFLANRMTALQLVQMLFDSTKDKTQWISNEQKRFNQVARFWNRFTDSIATSHPHQRASLLQAWQNFKATFKSEEYPSLPTKPEAKPVATARVLVIKPSSDTRPKVQKKQPAKLDYEKIADSLLSTSQESVESPSTSSTSQPTASKRKKKTVLMKWG